METSVELQIGSPLRKWLVISSLTAVSTGAFFVLLLMLPLVVFKGDFISGNVAVAWYSLENYGEPVYHPGLSSIALLSVPIFGVAFFNVLVGCLTLYKILKRRTISHILVETLIGALEACVIFIGMFFSLRLNVIHAASVLPTKVGGVNSAGQLVVLGSVRMETFASILIGQFYPLILLSALLLVLSAIVGHEAMKVFPIELEKTDETTKGDERDTGQDL